MSSCELSFPFSTCVLTLSTVVDADFFLFLKKIASLGGSHRPSFGSSSLKPSTVFHLTENEGSSSSTTVRRPSHSSTSSPAPPASEQQNYLPQLAEHQDQTPPLVERTSFTIEEPSSTDEGTDGLGGDGRDTGSLYSTRGALILFTVGMSQLLDNGTSFCIISCSLEERGERKPRAVDLLSPSSPTFEISLLTPTLLCCYAPTVSMTSVNMALTAISKELNIGQADEQVRRGRKKTPVFSLQPNLVLSVSL